MHFGMLATFSAPSVSAPTGFDAATIVTEMIGNNATYLLTAAATVAIVYYAVRFLKSLRRKGGSVVR